jgi:hypothetical protein
MRYIFEFGARRGVSDNLFLTSAAAYKKILQMEEARWTRIWARAVTASVGLHCCRRRKP